ncbi:MAG: hypothetical protein LBS30_05035 [Planctomycetota bacterium]|jgi:FdrA protein|nr:hypothetical protein [Planctomycetota bacterium]
MTAVKAVIKPDIYRDSIFLMKLSAEAARASGVDAVSAMMATERNKELFAASGLMTPEIQAAKAGDLAIAIKGPEELADKAVAAVMRLIDAAPAGPAASGEGGAAAPADIAGAKQAAPGLNFALISVAGDYARYEAAEALASGMDVMLYSDNISLADELALKRMAAKKGLLVMGPDCGTAIVGGAPLAFANAVRRGHVGIVGASGTGLQEVCCLLDRLGVGVSDAYGTGGRDLRDDIGGITAFAAIDRLAADGDTEALIILGKPPGKETRAKLLERLRRFGKPVFAHYVGAADYAAENAAGIVTAMDLTDLSVKAARHFRKDAALPEAAHPAIKGKGGLLHGIFGGGTLCQEAAEICGRLLPGDKYSNLSVDGFAKIGGGDNPAGHVFLDLGEDEFTVGRPHPMMAPDLKMERVVGALCNPEVRVVLMDMVIGYGAHPEQARLAAEALAAAAAKSGGKSREKAVVASVCGTEADRPGRAAQAAELAGAGVVVLPSNAMAARYAAAIAKGE